MEEFFHMGGYAAYVWTVYALGVVVPLALAVHSIADYRRQARLVEALEGEAGGRVRRAARPEQDR
ncbi:MAG: heme exporter protein CcmD [Parvibaculum sp.]|uniref:heme exporter protein CcmD n=1 Tax=Parvibaculum sp. TaxID=2024848 RepID=UPI001D2F28A6|nr:heme exporter protein CcmD [Parvibaculum sp.]MBX3489597.1 heme exporter protein CcmD [Parvibaculum sp.]MBX3494649.1 heme exporter protein CcmD [Parvibaculum sp.]MCW5726445.1 heme exporter protein CcmD [Parvibaculum sp.]